MKIKIDSIIITTRHILLFFSVISAISTLLLAYLKIFTYPNISFTTISFSLFVCLLNLYLSSK